MKTRKELSTKAVNLKPPEGDAAVQIGAILAGVKIAETDIQDILQATQRSLETVTHLTEYEDDKANRILTAMVRAHLRRMPAVVPSRFPLSAPLTLLRAGCIWEASLLIATYCAFVLYALTLTIGVALILHAVQPRFNVPSAWKAEGSAPRSRLFEKISEVSPTDWANSFVKSDKHNLLSGLCQELGS